MMACSHHGRHVTPWSHLVAGPCLVDEGAGYGAELAEANALSRVSPMQAAIQQLARTHPSYLLITYTMRAWGGEFREALAEMPATC